MFREFWEVQHFLRIPLGIKGFLKVMRRLFDLTKYIRKIRKKIRANYKFLKQIFEVQLLYSNLTPLRHKHNNCPTPKSVGLLWIPVWGCSDCSGSTGTMAHSGWLCPRNATRCTGHGKMCPQKLLQKPNRKPNLCQTRWFSYLQVKSCCSLPLLSGQEFSSAF